MGTLITLPFLVKLFLKANKKIKMWQKLLTCTFMKDAISICTKCKGSDIKPKFLQREYQMWLLNKIIKPRRYILKLGTVVVVFVDFYSAHKLISKTSCRKLSEFCHLQLELSLFQCFVLFQCKVNRNFRF